MQTIERMTYQFKPDGVCSRLFNIDVDDKGIVRKVEVVGGCSGNLQGLCRLMEGRPASELAETLKGIRCGVKMTSCPDQMSKAMEEIAKQNS